MNEGRKELKCGHYLSIKEWTDAPKHGNKDLSKRRKKKPKGMN